MVGQTVKFEKDEWVKIKIFLAEKSKQGKLTDFQKETRSMWLRVLASKDKEKVNG